MYAARPACQAGRLGAPTRSLRRTLYARPRRRPAQILRAPRAHVARETAGLDDRGGELVPRALLRGSDVDNADGTLGAE